MDGHCAAAHAGGVIERSVVRRLLIFILLVSGCTTIKMPSSQSLTGVWEHSSIFYSRLDLNEKGNGSMVTAFRDSEATVYSVSEYQTLKEGFSIKLTNIEDGSEAPEVVNFVLYEVGVLCMKDSETEGEDFCFMRSEDLEQSKSSAVQVLESLNNKFKNENAASGSDASSTRPF